MERYLHVVDVTVHPRAIRPREDLGGVSFQGHRCVARGVLVVVKHLLKAVQVEAIADILLINLAEELMVF